MARQSATSVRAFQPVSAEAGSRIARLAKETRNALAIVKGERFAK